MKRHTLRQVWDSLLAMPSGEQKKELSRPRIQKVTDSCENVPVASNFIDEMKRQSTSYYLHRMIPPTAAPPIGGKSRTDRKGTNASSLNQAVIGVASLATVSVVETVEPDTTASNTRAECSIHVYPKCIC